MGSQRAARAKGRKARSVKRCIECGASMTLAPIRAGSIVCEGYRCSECGHEVVTLEQMKAYERAKALERALKKERKIVRIGNAIGITLPMRARELGFEVGRVVLVEVIDDERFQIRLVDR